jgi:hypothetical protein
MLWREMRVKTKEENTKFLQDLDPMPQKEERLIGRIVNLDLLSLFPRE